MIAGIEQRGDRQMHRGHAARRADRADAALERGEPLFKHGGRRIGNSRIDVPGAFEIEQRGGVIGILKDVGRRLIDRHGARAGHGIRMLAGVQAQRFKRGRLWRGHVELARSGSEARFCHKIGGGVSAFWRIRPA